MADDRDGATFLWVWWHQVFNAWLLLFALLVFLPAGMYVGYQVSQPSRYSAASKTILDRLDDLEALLVKVQSGRPPNVNSDDRKLTAAIRAAQEAVYKLAPGLGLSIGDKFADIRSHAEDVAHSLDDQSRDFDHKVSQDLKEIRTQRDAIEKQLDSATGFWAVGYDQIKRFLKWIGALSFLTIVALCLLLFALNNPGIRSAITNSGTISAFGLSFSFADVPSVRASIAARQRAVGEDVVRAYSVALRDSHVEDTFGKVYEVINETFKAKKIDLGGIEHRATFYVPDFVGEDLVQATRYYGSWNLKEHENIIGRRFSIRYGIIGRAWRMIDCQYYANVRNDRKNLIRDWGFTAAESRPFDKDEPPSSSLMAFVLKDVGNQPPLGLIYLEAVGADKLHDKHVISDTHAQASARDENGLSAADRYARDVIWEEVLKAKEIKELKTALIRMQSVLRWNDKVEGGIGR